MAKKLDNIISINGEDELYEINAVEAEHATEADLATRALEAEKVQASLTVNKTNLDGTTAKNPVAEYNGKEAKTITIVPADQGGKFNREIRVPNNTGTFNNETVLNYNDIKNKVVDRLINVSSAATWDGTTLNFVTEENSLRGISLVTGTEANLNSFASKNTEVSDKQLLAYLYICEDNGNLYYGTSASSNTLLLSTVNNQEIMPKVVKVGENQWITGGKYGVDLANSDVINLNALFFTDYASQYNEGLNFVHAFDETNTVETILDKDKSAKLVYDRVYARDGKLCFEPNRILNEDLLPNPYEVYHSGNIVQIPNGGTGADNPAKAVENIVNNQNIIPRSIKLANDREAGLWIKDGKYGLDMSNSDMVNLNGLFFADSTDGPGEGIGFIRTRDEANPLNNTYDRIYALGGKIYFAPNSRIDTDPEKLYEVYHSGTAVDKIAIDADKNTIATTYQKKILTGTVDPNSTSASAAIKNAADGTIYIKYTK